jgi:hypothetical protein
MPVNAPYRSASHQSDVVSEIMSFVNEAVHQCCTVRPHLPLKRVLGLGLFKETSHPPVKSTAQRRRSSVVDDPSPTSVLALKDSNDSAYGTAQRSTQNQNFSET